MAVHSNSIALPKSKISRRTLPARTAGNARRSAVFQNKEKTVMPQASLPTVERVEPSLLEAISDYNRVDALYCSTDFPDRRSEAKFTESVYYPPLQVLENWKAPAQNQEECIEALKLLRHDSEELTGLGTSMLNSVTGYLSSRPDTELIALGEAYDQAVREWRSVWQQWVKAEDGYEKNNPGYPNIDVDTWSAQKQKHPVTKLSQLNSKLWEAQNEIATKIKAIAPVSIAGMAVKGRVMIGEIYKLGDLVQCGHEITDDFEDDFLDIYQFIVELNRIGLGRENLI